jgi:hypothetical protein
MTGPQREIVAPPRAANGVGNLDRRGRSVVLICLLYIDVLEHIQHDPGEAHRAAARLTLGGALVILCPAYLRCFATGWVRPLSESGPGPESKVSINAVVLGPADVACLSPKEQRRT